MNYEIRTNKEDVSVVSEVATRAIRRLNFLEWIILLGAALIAIVGGALVSWLIAPQFEVSFRLIWLAVSVLLLVVPGLVILLRSNRDSGRVSSEQKLRTKKRHG